MAGPGPHARAWRATLAGLCATLVGIGLARFAYTPLLPALITEGSGACTSCCPTIRKHSGPRGA